MFAPMESARVEAETLPQSFEPAPHSVFFLHENNTPVNPYIPPSYLQVNASKIIDGLYIGNQESGQDCDFLASNKITHIINCAGHLIPNSMAKFGVKYLTFRWTDTRTTIMFDPKGRTFKQICKFIDSALENSTGVLVISVEGRSKCCCIASAYLMRKYKWCLQKTIEFIKFKRPSIEPKIYFLKQLKRIERKLRIPASSHLVENRWIAGCYSLDEAVARNTFLNGHYIKSEFDVDDTFEVFADLEENADNSAVIKTEETRVSSRRLTWIDEVNGEDGAIALPHRPNGSSYNKTFPETVHHPSMKRQPASILKTNSTQQKESDVEPDQEKKIARNRVFKAKVLEAQLPHQLGSDSVFDLEETEKEPTQDSEDDVIQPKPTLETAIEEDTDADDVAEQDTVSEMSLALESIDSRRSSDSSDNESSSVEIRKPIHVSAYSTPTYTPPTKSTSAFLESPSMFAPSAPQKTGAVRSAWGKVSSGENHQVRRSEGQQNDLEPFLTSTSLTPTYKRVFAPSPKVEPADEADVSSHYESLPLRHHTARPSTTASWFRREEFPISNYVPERRVKTPSKARSTSARSAYAGLTIAERLSRMGTVSSTSKMSMKPRFGKAAHIGSVQGSSLFPSAYLSPKPSTQRRASSARPYTVGSERARRGVSPGATNKKRNYKTGMIF